MKKEELKSLLDEFKANIKKIDELNLSNKKIVEKFDLSNKENAKDEEKKKRKKRKKKEKIEAILEKHSQQIKSQEEKISKLKSERSIVDNVCQESLNVSQPLFDAIRTSIVRGKQDSKEKEVGCRVGGCEKCGYGQKIHICPLWEPSE